MPNRLGPSGIIVADDDPIVRDVLRASLASIDQDVYLAANGIEALQFASRADAALVIFDLNMPAMNGLVACQRLRRMPGYQFTPIVILTGNSDDSAKAAAQLVGATDFLSKPFRPAELLGVVARHLRLNQTTAEAIHRDAERADSIANLRPKFGQGWVQHEAGAERLNQLERGKRVLGVLRG